MITRNLRNHTFGLISLSMLAAMPAAAQDIREDFKLIAADGTAFDLFGVSVSLSGTIAIVGSWRDDDTGTDSGSAYLFDTTTGQQLFKLVASDAEEGDTFGVSVAISGSTAIIGARSSSDAGTESGSAYIFDAITGQQMFKLTATDAAPGDIFGDNVAISGSTAIVGARFNDDAGTNSGSAYIFDAATGTEMFKLTASDAGAGDFFGESVAVSGTTAVIGSRFDDTSAGIDAGSAYLFDITTGLELLKLTASDAAAGDEFGASVAITDATVMVGALGENNGAGAAYVFDLATGQELFKLTIPDAEDGDFLGVSLGLSANVAVVGAQFADDTGEDSGAAYLFDLSNGQQTFKLAGCDTTLGDSFGGSVAISGSTAIVGALLDDNVAANAGSMYVFGTTPTPCLADWNDDCSVNFFDITNYIADYNAQTPAADIAAPFGAFNFFDIVAFINLFNVGCP